MTLLAPHAAAVADDWLFAGEVLTALAWAQLAAGRHEMALATLARIPAPPSLWPFGKSEPPLPEQFDRAAILKAADDPGLEATLATLGKRLADAQTRELYLELTTQRLQLDPWQARRWRAHQELLQLLADGSPQR